jgi:hypothetical protein
MIKRKSSTRTPRSKTPAVVSADDAQAWATRINQHAAAAVQEIVATGRDLLSAKAVLPHGEWGRMFRGHPDPIAEPIRFSLATAEQFMAIARHPLLTKSEHVQSLPPSWGTLYQLTRVPGPALQKALTDGRIHPEMERQEVAHLRTGASARGGRRPPDRPGVQPWGKPKAPSASFQSLRRTLTECVSDLWDTLTRDDQEQVLALLARLHRECRAKFDRATVARYQETAGATYTEAPADARKKEAR